MVRSFHLNGRRHYRLGTSRERHDHERRQSGDTAIDGFDRENYIWWYIRAASTDPEFEAGLHEDHWRRLCAPSPALWWLLTELVRRALLAIVTWGRSLAVWGDRGHGIRRDLGRGGLSGCDLEGHGFALPPVSMC